MLEVANEVPMLLNSDIFAKAMQGSKEALDIVPERSFPRLQTIMSRLPETIPPDPIPCELALRGPVSHKPIPMRARSEQRSSASRTDWLGTGHHPWPLPCSSHNLEEHLPTDPFELLAPA